MTVKEGLDRIRKDQFLAKMRTGKLRKKAARIMAAAVEAANV